MAYMNWYTVYMYCLCSFWCTYPCPCMCLFHTLGANLLADPWMLTSYTVLEIFAKRCIHKTQNAVNVCSTMLLTSCALLSSQIGKKEVPEIPPSLKRWVWSSIVYSMFLGMLWKLPQIWMDGWVSQSIWHWIRCQMLNFVPLHIDLMFWRVGHFTVIATHISLLKSHHKEI